MAATSIFRDLGVFSKTIINTVPTQQGGVLIQSIIGFGKDWISIASEQVTKGSTTQDNTSKSITKVLNRVGDSPTSSEYVVGVDVQISSDKLGVQWLNNPLIAPTFGTPTTSNAISGGFTAGGSDQFYVVTALNAYGETIQSTEVDIVAPGSGPAYQNNLNWSLVPRATSYKLYRATGGSGVYGASSLVAQTLNTSYSDNNITLSTGTPPLATTAFNKPALNSSFFVTYDYYKVLADYAPKFVTRFQDVQAQYGGETINNGTFASPVYQLNQIGLAASLAFGQGVQGVFIAQLNNIPADDSAHNTLTSASGDGDIRNAYSNSLALLEAKSTYYICPLSTDSIVRQKTFDHCIKMSSESRRMERNAYLGFPSSAVIGDPSIPTSILGISAGYAALGGTLAQRIRLHPNGISGREGTLTVQNNDGTSSVLSITSEYWAVMFAARQSGMGRITFPINRKPLFGLDDMKPFSDEDRLTLQNNGLSVAYKTGETIISVSRAVTCADDFIERQEPTAVQQIDVVGSDMRQTLEQMYIIDGDAIIDESTPILVANSINVILRRNVNNKLISKYFPEATSAIQDPDTPTLIRITYKIKLVYPFLNAEITQVISLS